MPVNRPVAAYATVAAPPTGGPIARFPFNEVGSVTRVNIIGDGGNMVVSGTVPDTDLGSGNRAANFNGNPANFLSSGDLRYQFQKNADSSFSFAIRIRVNSFSGTAGFFGVFDLPNVVIAYALISTSSGNLRFTVGPTAAERVQIGGFSTGVFRWVDGRWNNTTKDLDMRVDSGVRSTVNIPGWALADPPSLIPARVGDRGDGISCLADIDHLTFWDSAVDEADIDAEIATYTP